ncbi:FecR family protein [Cyclobacterium plantarum]|uniref:DUF4974 domain-containing protein n=1 Tax=Cyclobacterium plantarum TaxID=2716263 RepID=A0ABX0HGW6_9BACT|nr:FecR family protein [Cyclobacterium plantarum]NHE59392.1 DUF4974 domain-containing protein [Cyclobacterium plantarum]
MIKGLLKKLLLSKLSKTEGKLLSNWLKGPESDRFFSEEFDEMVEKDFSIDKYPEWQAENLKTKILGEIRAFESEKSSARDNSGKTGISGSSFFRYAVAASVSLLLGIFIYSLYQNEPTASISDKQIISWLEKANPAGKKTIIHLSDGSKVYLNAESKIRYPENFKSDRRIFLDGEAFFEVAEDSLHPFAVVAGDLTTTALGTSFNIKSFPEESQVSLVLVTGKVKAEVSNTEAPAFLKPGQGISLSKGSGQLLETFEANLEQTLFWKEGILHFEQVSFMDLITQLERWYGVEITVSGDYPKNGGFSGTFKKNENLINVLQTIQFSEEFSFQSGDKKVLIQF